MEIRRLHAADARAYWETRNRGLKEFPDKFTTGVEEGFATIPSTRAKRFGYAGFQREGRQKSRHKGMLAGMYVVPEFRSNGSGKKLLLALIDAVRQLHDMEQLNLRVTHSNAGARQLYLHTGFVPFGLEKTRSRSMARTTTRNI